MATIFTRSKALAAKIQSQRPSDPEKSPSNENVFEHPNKRTNLASSTELKLKKKSLTKEIPTVVEKKKMEISDDEMSMNGAPAGDLYDVQVMNDSELFCFCDDDIAKTAFESATFVDKGSSSWAELFSGVEVTRRMALHHPGVLLSCECLPMAIQAAIDGSLSLRSSTIRNGIACMRSLAFLDIGSAHICRIVEVLMGRTGSGPKFIANEAAKVLDEIIPKFEPIMSIRALSSSTNIKNNEVSSKAFIMISQTVIRLLASLPVPLEGKIETPTKPTTYKEIIKIMSRGLNARSPLARDASREAFKAIKLSLGDVLFSSSIASALDGVAVKDIQREVNVESKSVPKKRPTFAGLTKPSGPPVTVFTTKGMTHKPGSAMLKQTGSMRPSIKEMIKSQQRRQSIPAVTTDEVVVKGMGSVIAIPPICLSPVSVIEI